MRQGIGRKEGIVLLFKRSQVTLVFLLAGILIFASGWAGAQELKVLAIGNSFSQDGVRLLPSLARDAGIESIVVGNMYIAGASLHTHWLNAQTNEPAYLYEKNVSGTWQARSDTTLRDALLDEDWDVVTIQQASGLSGVASSFVEQNRLAELVQYVRDVVSNPDVRLAWHMTWAYEHDSTHEPFANYGNDQLVMYEAIVQAVQEHIVPNEDFSFVIPAGTAIQNVRTSYIGDTLTRDGYHLTTTLGRYIAGLTWLKSLGYSIDDVTYVPSATEVPRAYWPVLYDAVESAVRYPFAITDLSHIPEPEAIQAIARRANVPDGYALFNWEPEGCAYWEYGDEAPVIVANNEAGDCFVVSSSHLFTPDDVPVGTIIEVERGFQYVMIGWNEETKTYRVLDVVTEDDVVTEEWWGDDTHRAVMVAFTGANVDISSFIDNVISRFRMYVPQ